MVFSSITFLLYFLPIFLLVYQISPKPTKNLVILTASIFFYSWGAPQFIFILLASTFLDFYIVRRMFEAVSPRVKKSYLVLSISLNLGLLAYFKYANFFVENLNTLFQSLGYETLTWASVALPIGISFYTFQTLTYSIDVYRRVHTPLNKVSDYILYIIMFPQLIAGPIVRFNSIAAQITERKETYQDKLLGFYRFCIGLGKKVLIANTLGTEADKIFALEIMDMSSGTAWLGILAYTFQIYFDFSGYSDMAIGLGRMMGFRFPENFNNPYCVGSITAFWKHWHITLGAWMKDYLYIPLGGNRVTAIRLYFNLCLVFVLSGLWHGAAWNFVLWGLYHGFFLVVERLFLGKILLKMHWILSLFYTFLVTILGWVIFKIEDLDTAFSFYKKLFIIDNLQLSVIPDFKFYIVFILAVFFSFFVLFPYGKKIQDSVYFKPYSNTMTLSMFVICLYLFIISIGAITTTGFNPFIYFRF